MSERSPEFWEIVETRFPEYAGDRLLDSELRRRVRYDPEADEKEIREERVIAASYDERIEDYFLHGVGSEEALITHLEQDYDLTEEEAEQAVHRALGQLKEVTDYGDEA